MESPSDAKFANTVLYLLERCPSPPGVTQLNKMLWYADFWHYRRHLRTITDCEYVAMERGPVPSEYKRHFDRLVDERIIDRREVEVFGHPDTPKQEFRALMKADADAFTEAERNTLDEVIRVCGDKSGNQLSEQTHLEGPWQMAWDPFSPYRPIPRVLFRWLDNLPNEHDIAAARGALQRPAVAAELAKLA